MAEWDRVFEADVTKTAMMLLAARAAGDRDAATAALNVLLKAGKLFDVVYATAAGFAELARPGRDRDQPYVNFDEGRLDRERGVIVNSLIAAAANLHRSEADAVLRALTTEQQVTMASLVLDLLVDALRRSGTPPAV